MSKHRPLNVTSFAFVYISTPSQNRRTISRVRNCGASRQVTACKLKSLATRTTHTATGTWNDTGTKSEPEYDDCRASSWARATASSGDRLSPAYLTLASSSPSGTLSVSTTRKAVRVFGSRPGGWGESCVVGG